MGLWAITWALSILGVCSLGTAPAHAAGFVLGDSLGLGVSRAGHLKNLSKISIHIRGRKMQEQIAQTPDGSTVFLVLGTNDAEGSIARLDKHIDDIVEAMEKKNITLIWLGPPCVRKAWDTRAQELDTMLRNRFENTAVRYVSMRDDVMCSGAFHERDGVHLKMKGYAYMWEKARSASGFAVAEGDTGAETEVTRTGSAGARTALKTASIGTSLPTASAGTMLKTGSVGTAVKTASAGTPPKTSSVSKSKKAQRIPLPVPRKPFP